MLLSVAEVRKVLSPCHNGGMGQPRSSFTKWKEARRKRALELKQHGGKQRTIAAAFGVSEAAVSKGGPQEID